MLYPRRTLVLYAVLIVTTISVIFYLRTNSSERFQPSEKATESKPDKTRQEDVSNGVITAKLVKSTVRVPPPKPTPKGAPPPRPTRRVAAKPTPSKCREIGSLLADPNLPPIIKSKYHSDVKVMLTDKTKTLDPNIGNWWRVGMSDTKNSIFDVIN